MGVRQAEHRAELRIRVRVRRLALHLEAEAVPVERDGLLEVRDDRAVEVARADDEPLGSRGRRTARELRRGPRLEQARFGKRFDVGCPRRHTELLERDLERIRSGYGNVGRDTDAFPVRAGRRVLTAARRQEHRKTPADGDHPARMCAAARRLADHARQPEHTQVVGERFAAGEGEAAREHVDRLAGVGERRR